jgi:hypothetical protein
MNLRYYIVMYFLMFVIGFLGKHRIFEETFMLLLLTGFYIWLSRFFQLLDCVPEKTKLQWRCCSGVASVFFINFALFFIFSKVW